MGRISNNDDYTMLENLALDKTEDMVKFMVKMYKDPKHKRMASKGLYEFGEILKAELPRNWQDIYISMFRRRIR